MIESFIDAIDVLSKVYGDNPHESKAPCVQRFPEYVVKTTPTDGNILVSCTPKDTNSNAGDLFARVEWPLSGPCGYGIETCCSLVNNAGDVLVIGVVIKAGTLTKKVYARTRINSGQMYLCYESNWAEAEVNDEVYAKIDANGWIIVVNDNAGNTFIG